jgi:23S rRNA (uridine2552-2'-O)-methyltransferase
MPNHREQDSYARKAKKEGFPARSVYKLEELDAKFSLLKPGDRVLDLGCHPGSWLIYAAKKIGIKGSAIGIDLSPTSAPTPWSETLQADIYQVDLASFVTERGVFDVVLSDMAPHTSGARDVDHLRSMALVERALEFALALLKPGGHFAFKVFMGGDLDKFVLGLKAYFEQVSRLRPKSTRAESREIFIVGKGRLPASTNQTAPKK